MKTFTVNVAAEGYYSACKTLDKLVNKELSNVNIHDWKDNFYPALGGEPGKVKPRFDACITRTVLYSKKPRNYEAPKKL